MGKTLTSLSIFRMSKLACSRCRVCQASKQSLISKTHVIVVMECITDWKDCERFMISRDRKRCCIVIPTGIGSDYVKKCKGEPLTFVDAKLNTPHLTHTQKLVRDF